MNSGTAILSPRRLSWVTSAAGGAIFGEYVTDPGPTRQSRPPLPRSQPHSALTGAGILAEQVGAQVERHLDGLRDFVACDGIIVCHTCRTLFYGRR